MHQPVWRQCRALSFNSSPVVALTLKQLYHLLWNANLIIFNKPSESRSLILVLLPLSMKSHAPITTESLWLSWRLALKWTVPCSVLLCKNNHYVCIQTHIALLFPIWYRACKQHILDGLPELGLFQKLSFSSKPVWDIQSVMTHGRAVYT